MENNFFEGTKEEYDEFTTVIRNILEAKSARDSNKSYVENPTKINFLLENFETKNIDTTQISSFIQDFTDIYKEVGLNFNPHTNVAHMLSEPSKVALIGHILGTIMGGNQVAKEVSPIENSIEIKTGKMIQELLGYKVGTRENQEAVSFITAGGTDANILALFVGRNVSYLSKEGINLKHQGFSGLISTNPNDTPNLVKLRTPKIIIPESSHYSLDKTANLLGVGEDNVIKVPSDDNFRIDTEKLERSLHNLDLKKEKPVSVVLVLGSTEIGAVDNLSEAYTIVQNFADEHDERIWVHLDAAHGLPAVLTNKHGHLRNILPLFDSITFDPHKLLWTPYNAGSITFKRKSDLQTISTDASYINNQLSNLQEFKKKLEEHLGGIKLIGSQSTSGIISTYLTLRYFGLQGIGEGMEKLFRTTQYLSKKLREVELSQGKIEVLNSNPDMNLIVFRYLPEKYHEYSKYRYFEKNVDKNIVEEIESVNKHIYKSFLNNETTRILSCVKLASSGIYGLRACIMNPRTTNEDVDDLVEEIKSVIERKIIRR